MRLPVLQLLYSTGLRGLVFLRTYDRGRQFTSMLWTECNKVLGTEVHTTTAYHPQANGMVERFHRQLKAALKARTTTPDWFAELPLVFLGIRSSWRVDPGCSPAELVYGSTLRLPGELFSAIGRKNHGTRLDVSQTSATNHAYCATTSSSVPWKDTCLCSIKPGLHWVRFCRKRCPSPPSPTTL